MKRVWYRQDREAVLAALRRGERPDLATPGACGPPGELIALREELGAFRLPDKPPAPRQRAGVPDRLLLRAVATLPLLAESSLQGAAGASLWGCLIRQRGPRAWPVQEAGALVSTRPWGSGPLPPPPPPGTLLPGTPWQHPEGRQWTE